MIRDFGIGIIRHSSPKRMYQLGLIGRTQQVVGGGGKYTERERVKAIKSEGGSGPLGYEGEEHSGNAGPKL